MDAGIASHIKCQLLPKLLTWFPPKSDLRGFISRWPDVLVLMLQGEKHASMSKITVFGRFWTETTLLPTFFSGSSAGEVVELEKLPHTESIGYMLGMFLAVKKYWKDYRMA